MTTFESKITPLTNGGIVVVNKPINYKFKIGDYLIYDKQQKFYYNFDNTESDKTTIIKIRQYNE